MYWLLDLAGGRMDLSPEVKKPTGAEMQKRSSPVLCLCRMGQGRLHAVGSESKIRFRYDNVAQAARLCCS